MKKLNCVHDEMKVLDITLIEIVPGDLRLEEDVPLLGQAQTALLVVGVVAVPFLVYYAQGCGNRCSLAAGLQGNGERMRK